MKQQTIEQRRAAYALGEINRLLQNTEMNRGEFRSYAKALPAMIHMNGLGQALAFCCAKGQGTGRGCEAYGSLYRIVGQWLTRDDQPLKPEAADENRPSNGRPDALQCITEVDMYHYRVAQAEALALMEWVRKFATAYMVDAGSTAAPAEGGGE